jgi:hypothetical protein
MIDTFNAYRALTAADRRLVREAALLLLRARMSAAIVPFSALRTSLGARRSKHALSSHSTERIVWSVTAVARRVPFRTTCLIDALAVDAMLRRRGVASDIRFGVKPPDGHVLAAHAWVEVEGKVVYGAISDLARYAVLSADGDVCAQDSR